MGRLLFFLCFFLCIQLSFGQQERIDSLLLDLKTKKKNERAASLEELSKLYIRFDLENSEKYALQLINEAKEINDSSSIAIGNKLLGNVYQNKSSPQNALKYFNIGLTYVKKGENSNIEGELLGSIGNAYSEMQRSDSAFYYWSRAKPIFEYSNNYKALTVLNFSIATNYYIKGDYIDAIEYLKLTEQNNEHFKNSYFEMRNNTLYGNIFTLVGRYDKAKNHIEIANKIAKENNYVIDVLSTSGALATIKAREGNIDEALEICMEAENIFKPYKELRTNGIVLSFFVSYTFLLIELNEISRAREIYNNYVNEISSPPSALEKDIRILKFYFMPNKNGLDIENELQKIYKSDNLVYKSMSLNVIYNIYKSDNLMSKAVIIQDSIIKTNKLISSETIANSLIFTLEELGVEQKEKENLLLRAETAENKNIIAQKTKRNWQLGIGLGFLLVLLASFFFVNKQRQQKQKIAQELKEIQLKEEKRIEVDIAKTKEQERIAFRLHRKEVKALETIVANLEQSNNIALADKIVSVKESIRQLAYQLQPYPFAKSSFEDQVLNLIADDRLAHLEVTHNGLKSIEWSKISDGIKRNLIIVLEENISNIYNHSNATKVDFSFEKSESNLIMEIKDNGKGFNLKDLKEGMGLEEIRIKIDEIDGTVHIDSEPRKGTRLQFNILLT